MRKRSVVKSGGNFLTRHKLHILGCNNSRLVSPHHPWGAVGGLLVCECDELIKVGNIHIYLLIFDVLNKFIFRVTLYRLAPLSIYFSLNRIYCLLDQILVVLDLLLDYKVLHLWPKRSQCFLGE